MRNLQPNKVGVPPLPVHPVPRTRLLRELEQAIPKHKLTLVSAPAGYGKTTLLAQWARESRLSVAWLSLAERERDAELLLRDLATAWQEMLSDPSDRRLGLLLSASPQDPDALLSAFVDSAREASRPLAFVIDDGHLLRDGRAYEALDTLLTRLPPTHRLVLASRTEPPLPLARYRAHGELLELRAQDLRFRTEETQAFLRARGLDLSEEEVASLQADVEGWAAGLQLASITLRPDSSAGADRKITGRHRFIADYLNADVLSRLAPPLRRFLLQTSLLDRLCGHLCAAVTGEEASQDVLELLERENLFLQPLDDDRTWYRYHPLFADVLRVELGRRHPDEVAALHGRAARWHISRGMPDEALHHAIGADDLELGLEIADRFFEVQLVRGEFHRLTRWLDSLPERWYRAYPAFGLLRAGTFLFTGAFEAGIRCVDEVEHALETRAADEKRSQMARVSAIRCAVACFRNQLPQAEAYAERALQDLSPEDEASRATIHHSLGDIYRRNRYWDRARERYQQVLALKRAPTFELRSVHAAGGLADIEMRQGHLRAAASCWRRALAGLESEPNGSFPQPLMGWIHLRLAEVLYEWNELEEASAYNTRGLDRARLGGDARVLFTGYLNRARLRLTLGDIDAAEEDLEMARDLAEASPDPEWRSRVHRFQLQTWLARGKLRSAVRWAELQLLEGNSDGRLGQEMEQRTMAQILIVKGDAPSLDRALTMLKELLEPSEREGRLGDQIEVLTLLALARWRRGDRSGSLATLERALALAEPEGYVRLFVDLGMPMARLLQQAEARDVRVEYVERLLASWRSAPSPLGRSLPDPLTSREQEVLALIAAGLTNREIADRIGVAPETVKKHASHIYGKLGVGNRTQAVARGLELGWLA